MLLPRGVGPVLSQVLLNGKESPIAYHSCILSKPERNYRQTDQEALAITSAVKKFNEYLQEHGFKTLTNHKPLLGLFNSKKTLLQMISPQVLR